MYLNMLETAKYELKKFKTHFGCDRSCLQNIYNSVLAHILQKTEFETIGTC